MSFVGKKCLGQSGIHTCSIFRVDNHYETIIILVKSLNLAEHLLGGSPEQQHASCWGDCWWESCSPKQMGLGQSPCLFFIFAMSAGKTPAAVVALWCSLEICLWLMSSWNLNLHRIHVFWCAAVFLSLVSCESGPFLIQALLMTSSSRWCSLYHKTPLSFLYFDPIYKPNNSCLSCRFTPPKPVL